MQKSPMLHVAEALKVLLATDRPLLDNAAIELLSTLTANGRVLASAQTSQLNVPPADNTQMDGYAVRAADCVGASTESPVSLPVLQRIPAGHIGAPLQAGSAARIFTGAMIPTGADAVVMQEMCEAKGDAVLIKHAPASGEWVRRAGEDIRSGSMILTAGTRLRPQHLGLAASIGLEKLPVLRKLRVAVFFTGDELAMPGEPLKPGAIYNSNRFVLRGLLENLGCEITDYGIVPDNLDATRDALRRAAQEHDLILTSGGVSVGEEDHVKPAVEAEGCLNLWQIAMKPGKPLAFGEIRRATGTPATNGTVFFIGLPGNPVSSFVTFLIFVRPFILHQQGVVATELAPHAISIRADFDWPKADRRREFLRARINVNGGLDIFPHQGSAMLTSTVWGDGLVDNPPGKAIVAGDMLRFLPFSALLQ